MRIISGTHKGKIITPDKNFKARPTTDFAKENLFNVLNNYIDIEDASVLDLFAGTGSISYELNYNHYAFIKKTAVQLGFKNMTIFKTDVFIACKKLNGTTFDIIFADPPYNLEKINEIPAAIFNNDLLAPDGIAIIEHPSTVDFSSEPNFFEHRRYGSVNFSIFKRQ